MSNPITNAGPDFRLPRAERWFAPRAVADGGGGTIIAAADIPGLPDRVFRALTTSEVEKWWGADLYRLEGYTAELKVCGQWSVTVRIASGDVAHHWGEFCEIDTPRKLIMTWRGDTHPLLGERETTTTYRLEPISNGTRLTVRCEGFLGRPEAAYGNAENWELVLGWLAAYRQSQERKEGSS